MGYANFFKVDPTRLFKTALQHDSVKIIICQSKSDADTLSVTPSDLDLTNIVYHKSEILGLELVDHIVISNLSIQSKTPLYYSHLENGAIYFVQNDMTHKSYDRIKPELDKARNEYGADKFIEGEAKGIDKGLIQGEKNRTIEMAKSMLKDGTDINFIMKHTGLTVDEINKIKKDMK